MEPWRIKIDLTYANHDVLISEFEKIVYSFQKHGYSKMAGGNNAASYSIIGPGIEPLSDNEIIRLRRLLED